ncbi:MAG: hypothetical protein IRY99_21205, partial [Isosphaeraceae bacterium]|nr:hypothetical protein [Isosphaeraceae bacterium]
MRLAPLGVGCMTSIVLLGCLPSPASWSPDGRWLAYTLAVRPAEQVLPAGWLFETDPAAGRLDAGARRDAEPGLLGG